MLCSLLKFIKIYSIITTLYHTDGTMYINKNTNVPVALNMKYTDYTSKNNNNVNNVNNVYNVYNVYNVTIIHDNRYSDCFYNNNNNNNNKYNYITYDKSPDTKKDILHELHKLHDLQKIQCVTSNWGEWSKCSDQCVMYRTRGVIKAGIDCPQLTEMKTCCNIEDNDDDEEEKDEEKEMEKDEEKRRRAHHLRKHIRDWINDPEPDDEYDKRRMRRIFYHYKKLRK
jgi:hypothetical protein